MTDREHAYQVVIDRAHSDMDWDDVYDLLIDHDVEPDLAYEVASDVREVHLFI